MLQLHRRSSFRWLALTVASFLVTPELCRGNESLREPLSRIAKAVAKVLKGESVETIAIGDFTGPPAFASSAGPGIKKILGEEFVKQGIRPKIGAKFGIQGKYVVTQGEILQGEKAPPHVRIDASLTDINGQILTDLNVEVDVVVGKFADGTPIKESTPIKKGGLSVDVLGNQQDAKGIGTLAEMIGGTTDLQKRNRPPPGEFDHGPNPAQVVESFQNPTAILLNNGTAVSASRESPFAMEILVNGQPRPLKLTDGQPFVDLETGDSFQIRLVNRARFDVAVSFVLDGVSSYAFSEVREVQGPRSGQPKYTRWIIPRGQTVVVKGWHRTNETVDKFLVTDFANSAAAKLGSTSGLGTITATIRATWAEGESPPEGEIISYPSHARRQGIGRGDVDLQHVQEDRKRRVFGTAPRAVITVRYTKPDADK